MPKEARSKGARETQQMRRHVTLGLAIVALYALHQDIWFWHTAQPMVFGFLPIGLAYHAVYCLAAAELMWTLTAVAWPSHLEDELHPKKKKRAEGAPRR